MSNRRYVNREDRIEATPETRAKLHPPIWQTYSPELVHAAKEIEYAVELIAGHLKMRAADFHFMDKAKDCSDFSDGQKNLIGRYRKWCIAMKQDHMHIGYIIEILAMDQSVRFENLLISALKLYDKVNYRVRKPKH
jgi:hypothetical protein